MAEAQLLYAKEPVIPISLWADAAAKGTDIGNAQKTTGQAIAQGITQGIEGYQKVRENEADIAIKQQAVEQAPLELELKRQQLENQKAITQINMMKAQADMLTQEQDLKVAKAKAEQELSILSGKSKLDKVLADPNHTKDFLNDPDINAALTSNNDLNKQVFGNEMNRTNADGTPVYTQEEKDAWLGRIDATEKYKIDQANLARAKAIKDKMYEDFDKVQKNMGLGKLGYIAGKEGLSPQDWINRVQIDPAGVKDYDPKTGILKTEVIDPATGKTIPVQDRSVPMPPPGATTKDFEVRILQPDGKWRRSNVVISDAEADNWGKYKAGYEHFFGKVSTPTVTPPPAPAVPVEQKEPGLLSKAFNSVAGLFKGEDRITHNTGFYTINPDKVSKDPVVRAQQANILQRAEQNPELAKELLSKGEIITRQAELQRSNIATNAVSGSTQEIPIVTAAKDIGSAVANSKLPIVEATKEAIKALSPEARNIVEGKILGRVMGEVLLSGVDSLSKAVAAVESGGRRDAKSPTGPVGLFQLQKDTAEKDLKVDRDKPEENVKGGVEYLKRLINMFQGNQVAALMAYNVGMGVVHRAIDITGGSDYESIMTGIRYIKNTTTNPKLIKLLTKDKLDEVAAYPTKVLAYKEAIDKMSTYV